jgi:hypothetical protein
MFAWKTALERPTLMCERHRDKSGEIGCKHGNTLVGTLRKHYGAHVARGCAESDRLSDCLDKPD